MIAIVPQGVYAGQTFTMTYVPTAQAGMPMAPVAPMAAPAEVKYELNESPPSKPRWIWLVVAAIVVAVILGALYATHSGPFGPAGCDWPATAANTNKGNGDFGECQVSGSLAAYTFVCG